ncbi:FHA domain-containing protein [Undibacterium pigrum]|nr:FHA domain-containing protein [Undibacterium pigrum]
MKKCQAPDHPYCTHWVAEGEAVCAAGHAQKSLQARSDPQRLELLNASAGSLTQNREASAPVNLHLHFSGYDPRAAGGRLTVKLDLRGKLPPEVSVLEVQLRSELVPAAVSRQRLQRTVSGQWQPLLISFSSKNKEHGQYPLEVILSHEQVSRARRKWICTSVIFVPRADASLTEIHSVFLAAQKNVRVVAEDGAIATLSGLGQSSGYAQGNMNIEINAKDASIAKLDMLPPTGKYEIAMGTIAWDEELIEVDATPEIASTTSSIRPAKTITAPVQLLAKPAATANIISASLIAEQSRRNQTIRLFARDEWVLGRMEEKPGADILLSHKAGNAVESARLTRRISARHAIIRRKGEGAEIVDVSRYGTLLDGISMEKDQAYALRAGMQIEFCASVRGITRLQVMAILPHLIILASADGGPDTELLYLIKPEIEPVSAPVSADTTAMTALPLLFHFQGNFWHRDMLSSQDSKLDGNADLRLFSHLPLTCRYASLPYADIYRQGAA